MGLLYNFLILLLSTLARLFSFSGSKLRLWSAGQREWKIKIREKIKPGDKTVWMHCASLGEFEQGRPVIESLKAGNPAIKIVITFFSPSGYEVRKNYSGADVIIYLPADTRRNAKDLIDLINPEFVIFVKYEFWYNYLKVLDNRKIPVFLISAIFRPGQHFFNWYGSFFRAILRRFSLIFVQDTNSKDLLSGIQINNVVVAGDTRFDRVFQIAGTARIIDRIEEFRGSEKLFIAGSSWKEDEEIIAEYINKYPDKLKWVFAPHEIHKENIDRLEKLFQVKTVRFSQPDISLSDARVLIIDNIGMLSSAYKYAYIAAVGGGFGKGIHNVLEPACWGIPVLFGPRHDKFREAVELVRLGGGASFTTYNEFEKIVNILTDSSDKYSSYAKAAGKYVVDNKGATEIILNKIMSYRY